MSGRTINKLSELAAGQWGLITRAQALSNGISSATFARLISDAVIVREDYGVYRLAGAPPPDFLLLRAAWLSLFPGIPAWERTAKQGIVSHRAAAALFNIGDLPADQNDFTLPVRKQSRRKDIRLHRRIIKNGDWTFRGGLQVTVPARIVSDLLSDREEPTAIATIIADSIRNGSESPGQIAVTLGPHAFHFNFQRNNGLGLLHWLLDQTNQPEANDWIDSASEFLSSKERSRRSE
jgi:hypothetical protein